MRKILFYLIIGLSFLITSCEPQEYPDNNNIPNDTTYAVIGYTWVISDARLYTINLDNSEKKCYDHFGATQFISVLDPFQGVVLPFDTIRQDVTTWNFGNNMFILDGTKTYDYTLFNNSFSIVGMENGSTRSIEILSVNNTTMTVKLYHAYTNDGTNNFEIFTTITFVKQGFSCSGCQPAMFNGYTYSGVINAGSVGVQHPLSGTKWVITKYIDGFGTSFPNDTLTFSDMTYTFNSSPSPKSYTLNSIIGNNQSELNLYGLPTLSGDYGGLVQETFIDDWQINSVVFTDLFNTNNNKTVWMVRIN